MNFTELHQQKSPLIIANVWDAGSAIAAQQAGFKALGTSSAAIAAMLGYEDGEAIPFDEMFYVITRIKSVCHVPLSVDLEAGFGSSVDEVATNLSRLVRLGISGINLEDSRVVNGIRQLRDAAAFADMIKALRQATISESPLFFNIRTDTYLLGHEQALQETRLRGQRYAEAGADGFFVPCLTQEKEIETLARECTLPLNVMCMPGLPSFDRLEALGVKRISMGNVVHSAMQEKLKDVLCTIRAQRAFTGVFTDERS
ncbi:isocitrate lyase/phosphoenolpyruvate mutase family protein [Leclercia adecarboxylata]|uniref:isocitrate lyase/PEP mutase family protein n=1 Tax=Leclercia adecarboxylata TaxID=83655 RepID=UPI00202A30A5|nr:isocitrate lyase/phosphoenolpyruvate mutase family protein [Leclercia adecarboxylata]URO00738.1 isocitrate lyase/phosphoenolpyruvate mutase family protein [Leclercia adecarboxylata]